MARSRTDPAPTSFAVPSAPPPDDVVHLLADRLRATEEPSRTETRTVLDAADRRLREAGVVLEAITAADRPLALAVRAWGRSPDGPATPVVRLPTGGDDVPARVGAAIESALDGAPLGVVGSYDVTLRPLVVRDDDAKIVVRAAVEVGQESTWVRLQPVRGYPSDAAAATAIVLKLGLRADAEPVEQVYAAAEDFVSVDSLDRAGVSAAAAWVAALQAQLAIVEEHLGAAIIGDDPEALHDVRVALRRSRSAVRQAKAVLPKHLVACFGPELAHLQRTTGPVRDLDVLVASLDARIEAGGHDLRPLRVVVADRLAVARAELTEGLRGTRARALLDDWRATLAALAGATDDDEADEWGRWPKRAADDARGVVRARIERQRARLIAVGRAIDEDSSPEEVHEVRKQGKELRYLVELFAEQVPETATPEATKAMRSLQNLLGRHHDLAVQQALVRELSAALEPDARRAADELLDDLEAQQRHEQASFPKRFGRVLATART